MGEETQREKCLIREKISMWKELIIYHTLLSSLKHWGILPAHVDAAWPG